MKRGQIDHRVGDIDLLVDIARLERRYTRPVYNPVGNHRKALEHWTQRMLAVVDAEVVRAQEHYPTACGQDAE